MSPTVLVIGPGMAAAEVAREVRDQGVRAVLLCSPSTDGTLGELEGIELVRDHELVRLDGAVGDLTAAVRSDGVEREVRCATIITVPGPVPQKGLNTPGVITLRQAYSQGVPEDVGIVTMVLRRDSPRPSFARALEVARRARARPLPPEVWIFSPEMRAYGMEELAYVEAQAMGVRFVRSSDVALSFGPLTVEAMDSPSDVRVSVRPELVIVDGDTIAEAVTLLTGAKLEEVIGHVSMVPAATLREGVFTCASPSGEMLDDEIRTRARAAASRAVTLALHLPQRAAAVVDRDRCSACLTCVRSCPHLAARPGEEGKAVIDSARCQACGVCLGGCPSRALSLPGDTTLTMDRATMEGG